MRVGFCFYGDFRSMGNCRGSKCDFIPKQNIFLFLFPRAGKPPPGLHLDVVKGDKLIEV